MMRREYGFTLLEIMIAVAIVAILARIAYPSYMSSVYKSQRSDAFAIITTEQGILERCFAQNFSYNLSLCTAITSPVSSPKGYYTTSVSVSSDSQSYTITATAQGNQVGDTQCQSFSVTQANVRTALSSTNSDNSNLCWVQ